MVSVREKLDCYQQLESAVKYRLLRERPKQLDIFI